VYRLDLKRVDPEKLWVQRIEVAEIKEIPFNNPAHSRSLYDWMRSIDAFVTVIVDPDPALSLNPQSR